MTRVDSDSTPSLAPAARLARAGRFREALELILASPRNISSLPQAKDLMARIHAQQGELREAEVLWADVLRDQPGNPTARAALSRLRAVQCRAVHRDGAPRPLLRATAVIALAASVALPIIARLERVEDAIHGQRAQAADQRQALERAVGRVAVAQRRLANAATGQPTVAGRPREITGTSVAPPDIDFGLPGVTVAKYANAAIVSFRLGLFTEGAALDPKAEALINEIARRLASERDPLMIQVIGHTDDLPDPEPGGNEQLGLRRAIVVADRLRVAGLRAELVAVSSVGAEQPVYPNDRENRARNRTVVLRITRAPS
jgi:outer membrane protein OmpA-like peptidoglycan-associated protein